MMNFGPPLWYIVLFVVVFLALAALIIFGLAAAITFITGWDIGFWRTALLYLLIVLYVNWTRR
ncbi:hypothetical protein BBD42_15390 [Paenibacillus sp. BIHB 4019]|uniref:Uncharacterized protein n=1 Tax=Paenibacillus sp. BIHB 4019 TaxID=1870819 RepID=A0A1B2DJ46_9BACL|nr:hypothetical protein [Paenibacillus sp. BIHB 4019]ANY67695.1 hypothetical protein BBD42_15390 [Paenibacillus sp. BIHB 4019]